MKIALIAHDSRKELMIQLCIAYKGILEKHKICATGATANVISEASGLTVQRLLDGGRGGLQQISSFISCNEIDLLLFMRDPLRVASDQQESDILRLCDVHDIPIATNIATAEALIHALENGVFDWRENIR